MTPLTISVAICTFNGERFLGKQLESIAAQERAPDKMVVCDDGSSDRTVEILREFASRAPFSVQIEINPVNLGSTRNFEKCISLCRGNIVALADQDDVWYPHKLRRLEEVFETTSEVVAAFSDADVIDQDSRRVSSHLWTSFGLEKANQKKLANGRAIEVLCNHPVVTGATLAFRRHYFDAMRPIPPMQFHDAWIVFLLAACGRFAVIPEPLMQYRQHERQQVGPGPSSLRLSAQVAGAMKQNERGKLDDHERIHELYRTLNDRAESFPYAQIALRELAGKLSHLDRRTRLPKPRIARLPGVLHEVLAGAYWRYSSGWKSAAKDLIFP